MNQLTKKIEIDRLVSDGLELRQEQAEYFRLLLERALARNLSSGELLKGSYDISRIQAPKGHIGGAEKVASLAASVAQSVAATLRSGKN